MSVNKLNLKTNKESIDSYVRWLKNFPFVEEVYLFGSRARGTNREDSDWDLLIKTDRKVDFSDPKKQFGIFVDLQITQKTEINGIKYIKYKLG